MSINFKYFKYFNEKRENALKRLTTVLGRSPEPHEKEHLPKKSKFDILSIKLKLFSKEIKNFTLNFYNDANEYELGFYFLIPFLLHFEFKLGLECSYYKKMYPEMIENDYTSSTGFYFSREYINFTWLYYSSWDCDKSKGFKKTFETSEIFKGERTFIDKTKPELVLETSRTLVTNYKPEFYNGVLDIVHLVLNFKVYKVVYSYKNSRWFNEKHIRWEVVCEDEVIVPGKGENSWDCDDEIIKSLMLPDNSGAGFSCGSSCKTAEEAVNNYINMLKKKLNR